MQLDNCRIAILVADGFEQVEMAEPRKALEQAGAKCDIVSPNAGQVKAFKHDQPGDTFNVDVPLDRADPNNYDALYLPGGVMNPDHLRRNPKVQQFVRSFFDSGKPVGAICHGPWTLIDSGVAKGLTLTSYHTIQMDLKNAGANWVDREVVEDRKLITSRQPDDLPAFCPRLVDFIARARAVAPQARHAG